MVGEELQPWTPYGVSYACNPRLANAQAQRQAIASTKPFRCSAGGIRNLQQLSLDSLLQQVEPQYRQQQWATGCVDAVSPFRPANALVASAQLLPPGLLAPSPAAIAATEVTPGYESSPCVSTVAMGRHDATVGGAAQTSFPPDDTTRAIESAVADFLSGKNCEEESDQDDFVYNWQSAAALVEGSSVSSPADDYADDPEALVPTAPRVEAPTGVVTLPFDRPYNPYHPFSTTVALQRGKQLAKSLRELPLPKIPEAAQPAFVQALSQGIHSLHLQGQPATFDRVKDRLCAVLQPRFEFLRPEQVELALLFYCGQDSHVELAVGDDAQIILMLTGLQGRPIGDTESASAYNVEFLEALSERFNHMVVSSNRDGATPSAVTQPHFEEGIVESVGSHFHADSRSAAVIASKLRSQQVQTLMIRNIPSSVSRNQFAKELNESGFDSLFDFFYLPSSALRANENKGYAFVNLITEDALSEFVLGWHGSRRFDIKPTAPELNVSAAAYQGLERNLKKWESSRMRRLRNPALRPCVASPHWSHGL